MKIKNTKELKEMTEKEMNEARERGKRLTVEDVELPDEGTPFVSEAPVPANVPEVVPESVSEKAPARAKTYAQKKAKGVKKSASQSISRTAGNKNNAAKSAVKTAGFLSRLCEETVDPVIFQMAKLLVPKRPGRIGWNQGRDAALILFYNGNVPAKVIAKLFEVNLATAYRRIADLKKFGLMNPNKYGQKFNALEIVPECVTLYNQGATLPEMSAALNLSQPRVADMVDQLLKAGIISTARWGSSKNPVAEQRLAVEAFIAFSKK